MNAQQQSKLAQYCKSKVVSAFDPSFQVVLDDETSAFSMPHKGFYIGFSDSSGTEICRDGFLKDNLLSVFDSANTAIIALISSLKSKNVVLEKIHSGTFYYTLVTDCIYFPDPLGWDENADGVYFMWGQNYRGLYLPHQIKKMNISKIDIMDRLCAFESHMASSLWRLPEGMVWALKCMSFSG